MQRILITGVTGFLGTNLVNFLSRSDNYSVFGHSRDFARARRQFADCKVQIVEKISSGQLNEMGIDTVIHLAGIAHDLSNRIPAAEYFQVNEGNTKIVFDDFLSSNASKFIFLSSIKAAVNEANEPAGENIAPQPVTTYGKSKLKAELYIQSSSSNSSKRVYIFRPCMIHGPGNKGNLNSLYRFVKLGLPYPLGAFDNRRSFLSIDNFTFIVQKFLSENISSGVYHLADDGSLSTKELYLLITSVLGKKGLILNIPAGAISLLAVLAGRKKMLGKLTESMIVSNDKLIRAMNSKLPVALSDGISKTIHSFL